MVRFDGAIEYIILKKNDKYILFFLDKHGNIKYCEKDNKILTENIDVLFSDFLDNSLFLFEEIVTESKIIEIFPDTKHLQKYMQFYNINKNKSNIIPIDLRILFDTSDLDNIFMNLDILFNCNININKDKTNNTKVFEIKEHIYIVCKISPKFNEYFNNLKKHYLYLKNQIINDIELINLIKNNNSSNFLEYIYLDYPWEYYEDFNIVTKNNVLQIYEIFLSGLLELYAISFIEITNTKHTILYLGAAHCINIIFILEKYF